MRLHSISLMALSAAACLAPNVDGGGAPPLPPLPPQDGQIALTAHNNGDGTWSVKRGPNGPVLRDGLAREQAYAIVGGATGPYEPANAQEAEAAEQRAALEAKEAEREASTADRPDGETGDPLKVGRSADAALAEENARLVAENVSQRQELEDLRAQLAKFDADGDGNPGGSTGGGQTKDEIAAELTKRGVEFDPKLKKADLVALLAAQPPQTPAIEPQALGNEPEKAAGVEKSVPGDGNPGGEDPAGKNNGG